MKRLLLAIGLTLSLAGCVTPGAVLNDISTGITVATSSVANPITNTNIYQLKNGYAAALQLSVDWRNYCWSKPYAVLMADPVTKVACKSRRATVRTIQATKARAKQAIADAQNFVAQNPTVNAVAVVNAAWAALTSFQNAVPAH